MIDSAAIKAAFRDIRRIFTRHGISAEVQVAEAIAFLLVVYHDGDRTWVLLDRAIRPTSAGHPSSADLQAFTAALRQLREDLAARYATKLIPQPPPVPDRLPLDEFATIRDRLAAAVTAADNRPGLLFQRYLRFELLQKARGGQYPTPYHLAALMARLIDLRDGDTVLDPTCGTGGLLVAAGLLDHRLTLTGYEYDPNWAALAWSNLHLNGHRQFTVSLHSAFTLGADAPRHTRILMNPPFGGNRTAAELAESGLGQDYGTRTETTLTAHALTLLAVDGRAAVLVSSTVLFGTSGEQTLRAALQPRVEAIVKLPPDAFQPYNSASGNLLLFGQAPQRPGEPVWLIRLDADGYEGGTSRDLSAPTRAKNEQDDLPLLVALIDATRADSQANDPSRRVGDLASAWSLTPTWNPDPAAAISPPPPDAPPPLPGCLVVSLSVNAPNHQVRASTLGQRGLLATIHADGDPAVPEWFALLPGTASLLHGTATRTARIDVSTLSRLRDLGRVRADQWNGQVSGREETILSFTPGTLSAVLRTWETRTTTHTMTIARQRPATGSLALLVSDEGTPLTPLLHANIPPETLATTLEKLNPTVIRDRDAAPVGYLLSLNGDANGEAHTAHLFIWAQRHPTGYTADGQTAFLLGTEGEGLLLLARGSARAHIGTPIPGRPGINPRRLLLATDGRLLGVAIPPGDLGTSWQPQEYLPEPAAPPLKSAAELGATIRQTQFALGNRVNHLLRLLAPPAGRAPNPAPAIGWLDTLGVSSWLNDEQRRYWDRVRAALLAAPGHDLPLATETYAVPQHHLDIFERLGLLIASPRMINNRPVTHYRLTNDNDVAKPAAPVAPVAKQEGEQ